MQKRCQQNNSAGDGLGSGFVAIASSYSGVEFDNVSISQHTGQFPSRCGGAKPAAG